MSASIFHVAHKAIETRTVTLAGAGTVGRACGYDSSQVTAVAARAWGVFTMSGLLGERVGIVTEGSVPVEIGAAVTIGQPLTTDTSGRFVPATAGQYVLGRALGADSAAGKFIEMHITREGTI